MKAKPVNASASLRCLIIFQLKLAADALRDLIMSPISIICFLLDVVFKPDEKDSHYSQLMEFGRKTDRWINLFEEHSEEQDANLKS